MTEHKPQHEDDDPEQNQDPERDQHPGPEHPHKWLLVLVVTGLVTFLADTSHDLFLLALGVKS